MTADDKIVDFPGDHGGTRSAPCPELPDSLRVEITGDIAVLTLDRAKKRNALNDETVIGLGAFFAAPPTGAKVVVLVADGDHFSAGLDLSEVRDTDAVEGMHHSRMWHDAFSRIESGPLPVIAVLKGAVVGGGLELAVSAHLRIAEDSAYFALPEGQRGLFVGGGASVRVPRLIGTHRMVDMMLTGRVLSSDEGESTGLVHYRTKDGEGLALALDLAGRIAANSPVTNYAVLQALPRIAESDPRTGLLIESLMAGIAQSSPQAKSRIDEFLAGRAKKVTSSGEAP